MSVYELVDHEVRVATPVALEAAGLPEHAARLRDLDPIVDVKTAEAADAPVQEARLALRARRQR